LVTIFSRNSHRPLLGHSALDGTSREDEEAKSNKSSGERHFELECGRKIEIGVEKA